METINLEYIIPSARHLQLKILSDEKPKHIKFIHELNNEKRAAISTVHNIFLTFAFAQIFMKNMLFILSF